MDFVDVFPSLVEKELSRETKPRPLGPEVSLSSQLTDTIQIINPSQAWPVVTNELGSIHHKRPS